MRMRSAAKIQGVMRKKLRARKRNRDISFMSLLY
jgi:hypothetical protein